MTDCHHLGATGLCRGPLYPMRCTVEWRAGCDKREDAEADATECEVAKEDMHMGKLADDMAAALAEQEAARSGPTMQIMGDCDTCKHRREGHAGPHCNPCTRGDTATGYERGEPESVPGETVEPITEPDATPCTGDSLSSCAVRRVIAHELVCTRKDGKCTTLLGLPECGPESDPEPPQCEGCPSRAVTAAGVVCIANSRERPEACDPNCEGHMHPSMVAGVPPQTPEPKRRKPRSDIGKPRRSKRLCVNCDRRVGGEWEDKCPHRYERYAQDGCGDWHGDQPRATRRDATPPPAMEPEPTPDTTATATPEQRANHIASCAIRLLKLRTDKARIEAEIEALIDDENWEAIEAVAKAVKS